MEQDRRRGARLSRSARRLMWLAVLGTASTWSLAAGPALADTPPSPGGPPAISGTPQQGNLLSVDPGTWSGDPTITFTYQWSDGQTGQTVLLSAADVGQSLTVTVTGTNDFGSASATSDLYGPVLPAAPAPGNPPPAITGNAQQGDTLSVSNGGWDNNPTRFTYAWEDCDSSGNNCVPITGATSSSYTLQAPDVGSTVVAQVTGSNAGGQGSATSSPTASVLPAAPTPGIPAPGIGGVAQQGDTLTVSSGGWDNNPTTFGYAWEDCDSSGNNCVPITGATSSSYTLQAADVGSTVVAKVTASNTGGQGSATSAPTASVLPAPPAPGNPPPGITGTAQQGHTLTVSNGTWTNKPIAFSYVWEDCSGNNCTAIAGATASTYTLQASDVGSTIVATVTAANAGGQGSATSAATASILPAAPGVITAPGISGTAQQGKTLSVSRGSWSSNPTSYAYAWQDCDSTDTTCSAISGATSTTYTVQASQVAAGDYVSVMVTATNSGGRGSVTTASVGPVLPPAPTYTQAPSIFGSGATLTVNNGEWNNANANGYSYAWESCNSAGANCTPIPGATSGSYALSLADVGSTIACVVTATGPGGSFSVTIATTSVVAASQIPPASQPTTTDLLITPSAAVTNQTVTLIGTVTAGTSSTALWGRVTFENGGTAIPGCANMPAVPSGRSATVACSTSFAASTAQLSAVFTPTAGSILKGSVSQNQGLVISPDATSTSLDAAASVTLGASITYRATVAPPAARPGPVKPTGAVMFFDAGQPIGSCADQALAGGAATCTVNYAVAGAHQITARYSGDANFGASRSAADQVNAAPAPTSVLGTITATMQWAFYFSPKYTVVRNLVVNGAPPGATVVVRCQGRGCPFANHATLLTRGKRCGAKAKRSCLVPGMLSLTAAFAGRHLKVGTRITVSIVERNWVGKSYAFTIRPRRGPRVQIGSIPVA